MSTYVISFSNGEKISLVADGVNETEDKYIFFSLNSYGTKHEEVFVQKNKVNYCHQLFGRVIVSK